MQIQFFIQLFISAEHEFDWLFSVSWQAEVCAGTVAEVIQSVVNGADGCVFCFGHSKLGKRQMAVTEKHNLLRIYIQCLSNIWAYHEVPPLALSNIL